MPNVAEPHRPREDSREQFDLCQQYRPIGIGAVAAALAAAGKAGASPAPGAANSNERIGSREPLAA